MRTLLLPASTLAVGLILAAGGARADVAGFELGAYRWHADYDGTVQSGPDKVDLNHTLGFDDDNIDVIYFALEHPIPLLPNLRLQHTKLESSASARVGGLGFEFDDEFYFPGETVRTNIDLTHTDATFYYELLDNVVSLDAGLTVRYFDGGVQIRSQTDSATLDLDDPLPLLYLAARVELPLGFYAGGDVNAFGINDASLLDYRLNAGWESSFGLGLELGLRRFDLQYDDGDEEADITVDGAYGQIFFHF